MLSNVIDLIAASKLPLLFISHKKCLGALWKCTDCWKIFKKKNVFGRHVETHLDGFVYKCNHCDKIHKTSGSLMKHINRLHRHEVLKEVDK